MKRKIPPVPDLHPKSVDDMKPMPAQENGNPARQGCHYSAEEKEALVLLTHDSELWERAIPTTGIGRNILTVAEYLGRPAGEVWGRIQLMCPDCVKGRCLFGVFNYTEAEWEVVDALFAWVASEPGKREQWGTDLINLIDEADDHGGS